MHCGLLDKRLIKTPGRDRLELRLWVAPFGFYDEQMTVAFTHRKSFYTDHGIRSTASRRGRSLSGNIAV